MYQLPNFKYPLVKGTLLQEDISALIRWLSQIPTPRLTKDKLNDELEEKMAAWMETKYSVFVNSGSSANLLMLSVLKEKGLFKRNKVVLPALSWSTDLAPICQLNLEPILCDNNLNNLSLDLEHVEYLFKHHNPDVLLLVSVLGLVPDMKEIVGLCERYDVTLLMDCCEAIGSKYHGQRLVSFGEMSTISTYMGHEFSTCEGGFLFTNNNEFKNIALVMRAHGWLRDCDKEYREQMKKEWNVTDFMDLYSFYSNGFNFRNTDLHAFLGLEQLKHLDSFIAARNRNFNSYVRYVNQSYWKPAVYSDRFVSNFAYPLIVENRDYLVDVLRSNGIECRPLIAGSLGRQPFYIKQFRAKGLKNADKIHNEGLYIPNNHELTEDDIQKICNVINHENTYEIS